MYFMTKTERANGDTVVVSTNYLEYNQKRNRKQSNLSAF